ncbi:MAG: alpha/beta hydrolase [Planctomycetota bacterium]
MSASSWQDRLRAWRYDVRTKVALGLIVYAILVAISWNISSASLPDRLPTDKRYNLTVPAFDANGPVADADTVRMTFEYWGEAEVEMRTWLAAGGGEGSNLDAARDAIKRSGRPPVLLLHGSPGMGANFEYLGPLLADAGYHVIAPDLPGFGWSDWRIPDYSIAAHARYAQALLDELGIDRAHIVGWSNGGGVALHMADNNADRLASLTMLASVGLQEAEGSGDYFFEHAKYALGYIAIAIGPDLLPHFGLFGPHEGRLAFIRNFWDTDQRPLRAIMEQLTVPTLVLHGRDDFLTPAWGAEAHHDLIPTSRLVMMDASHFLPFVQPEATASHLVPFLERHDMPGVEPVRTAIDLAPVPPPTWLELGLRLAPWWSLVPVFALLVWWKPELGSAVLGSLVAAVWLDIGVASVAAFLAMLELVGRRHRLTDDARTLWHARSDGRPFVWSFALRFRPWERSDGLAAGREVAAPGPRWAAGAVLGCVLWTAAAILPAFAIGTAIAAATGLAAGWVALVSIYPGYIASRGLLLCVTPAGRARLIADIERIIHHEYWPTWLLYLPIVPYLVWLAARHGGPMTWTSSNPGIPDGGGVIGESKHEIMSGFDHPGALPHALLPAGGTPEERATRVRTITASQPELRGDAPGIILKPDAGQRGVGVRFVADPDTLLDVLRNDHRPMVIQRYHPGPNEAGVLWYRDDAGKGCIFSINRKTFPAVIGDGKRTLEQLIYAHKRYRRQADVFMQRLGARRDEIPKNSSVVSLGKAGNHAQGALFSDGEDLITPALEAALTDVVASYTAKHTSYPFKFGDTGLDFGRFDLRYDTDDALKRGEGFGIVELNGNTSESTNIYDPSWPVWRSYLTLARQWKLLFAIGARRSRMGVRPMTIRELARAIRKHYGDRPQRRIAD